MAATKKTQPKPSESGPTTSDPTTCVMADRTSLFIPAPASLLRRYYQHYHSSGGGNKVPAASHATRVYSIPCSNCGRWAVEKFYTMDEVAHELRKRGMQSIADKAAEYNSVASAAVNTDVNNSIHSSSSALASGFAHDLGALSKRSASVATTHTTEGPISTSPTLTGTTALTPSAWEKLVLSDVTTGGAYHEAILRRQRMAKSQGSKACDGHCSEPQHHHLAHGTHQIAANAEGILGMEAILRLRQRWCKLPPTSTNTDLMAHPEEHNAQPHELTAVQKAYFTAYAADTLKLRRLLNAHGFELPDELKPFADTTTYGNEAMRPVIVDLVNEVSPSAAIGMDVAVKQQAASSVSTAEQGQGQGAGTSAPIRRKIRGAQLAGEDAGNEDSDDGKITKSATGKSVISPMARAIPSSDEAATVLQFALACGSSSSPKEVSALLDLYKELPVVFIRNPNTYRCHWLTCLADCSFERRDPAKPNSWPRRFLTPCADCGLLRSGARYYGGDGDGFVCALAHCPSERRCGVAHSDPLSAVVASANLDKVRKGSASQAKVAPSLQDPAKECRRSAHVASLTDAVTKAERKKEEEEAELQRAAEAAEAEALKKQQKAEEDAKKELAKQEAKEAKAREVAGAKRVRAKEEEAAAIKEEEDRLNDARASRRLRHEAATSGLPETPPLNQQKKGTSGNASGTLAADSSASTVALQGKEPQPSGPHHQSPAASLAEASFSSQLTQPIDPSTVPSSKVRGRKKSALKTEFGDSSDNVDWAMCDHCNKWRVITHAMYMRVNSDERAKWQCSDWGRSCAEPTDG